MYGNRHVSLITLYQIRNTSTCIWVEKRQHTYTYTDTLYTGEAKIGRLREGLTHTHTHACMHVYFQIVQVHVNEGMSFN